MLARLTPAPDTSLAGLGIHSLIVRNLDAMGYRQPRPIQFQAIPPIIDGRDVIGLAETGTGKTAAFITPIAHLLLENAPPRPRGRPVEPMTRLRALVLCPTRELARQVADEAKRIAQGTVLRIACAYGKVALRPQAQAIARGVDLLVATPGRVRELLDSGALALAYVRHLTIDEADRMLDLGFLPQVEAILRALPAERQMLLFTATMPGEVAELAERFLRQPVRVEAGRQMSPAGHLEQHLLPVAEDDKVALLLHLIESGRERGVLVFCRTRRRVGWVGTALQRNGIAAGMLHGDRTQSQREKTLARFISGELRVLVATDVAARGLHIKSVRTVVNYDLPIAPEEYVHRVGRAGHGGGFGEAFTLLDQSDVMRWRAILNTLGIEVYAEEMPGFKPTVQRRSAATAKRAAERRKEKGAARAEGEPRQRKGPEGERPRRSRRAKPIRKGEKPGAGVRRPE